MKPANLIHATRKFMSNNGPVIAVISLYTGIFANYIDTL